jgi:hypothetical protein
VRLSADLADNNFTQMDCFIYYRRTGGARQEKKPPKSGGSAARCYGQSNLDKTIQNTDDSTEVFLFILASTSATAS